MKDLPAIESSVRDHYLTRLPMRLTLIRQLFAEHRWTRLKQECEKLCRGAKNHGIDELRELAEEVYQNLPTDDHGLQSLDEDLKVMLQRLLQWQGGSQPMPLKDSFNR